MASGVELIQVNAKNLDEEGVFGIVLDGRLLSYHYLLAKDFEQRLAQ